MANGFITLTNGKDFATRWTGYDMIIQIAIHELESLNEGPALANWLKTRIPQGEVTEGGAIFWNQADEMISRILDLRGLTPANRALFIKGLRMGQEKLLAQGEAYSSLHPERIPQLLSMHDQIVEDFVIEEETDTHLIINQEKVNKEGPGWN
ncbi:MAG: hypothetical protein AAF206_06935 [Bacteroidota bacterium]